MELMRDWSLAENETLQAEVIAAWRLHGVSAGDIVKCAAKTANAADELKDALVETDKVELVKTLSGIQPTLIKGLVRSDSLYV